MTAISVKSFDGLKPIVAASKLPATSAQVAKNCKLVSGGLLPMKLPTTLKATVLTNPATIFRYGDSATETDYWLEFSQDTDVMRSPIAQDQYERLYWTDGNNKPRYAPNNLILQAGTGAYPRASYELGIPAPSTAPTITASTAVVNATTVQRDYVMTFYNPTTSKESLPGSVFSIQGVDGQKVAFSSLTTNNLGDAGVTKKRIYRKVSGTFRRVVELDLITTTYDDEATDASLASAASLATAVASAPAAPVSAPGATAPTVSGASSAISRGYIYTIKGISVVSGDSTSYYVESGASPVRTVSADSTQTVTIAGMSNTLGGSHFRVYRKDAGSSAYQFVVEVPVSQTSVTDVIASTTLGSTLNYDAPSNVAPGTAPTGSVNSSTAVSASKRVYMVTYLDSSGVESGKSPVSPVVTVMDGSTTVTLTHSTTTPAGVAKKRFYRQTVTITNGVLSMDDANWKLVTEVTASTTSTTDSAADSTLSGTLSTSLRNLPPSPNSTPGTNATIPAKKVPESRTYVITYVSAYGEEGPPSPASDIVDLDPEQSVTVSMPGGPSGNYNITLKRLYRSSTVGSQAQFQFVAEIPVATSSYVDSVKQAALGEVLPSTDWVGPPAGLKGLRLMANGAAVGFVGKTLYLSEPNLPHAWPHQYPVDFDIVGVAVFGQTVAVLTKGFPYLFQGIDPAAMAETKMALAQACVNKRSIVETGDGVVYASPDGLVSIGAQMGLITQNLLSREQWQAYVPSSIECYMYNNRVHAMYNTGSARGTLVFDFTGQGATMTTNDINTTTAVTAGYYEPKKDILYLAQGTNIVRFDAGSVATGIWRSKAFRLDRPENLGFAQVNAYDYPVTMRIYAEGVLKMTKVIPNNNQFRLPSGFRAYEWMFELEFNTEVIDAAIVSSSGELRSL